MSFAVDVSQVLSGLSNLQKLTPEMANKAVAKAGMRLLRDGIMEMPTVPLDEGTLRGSGSVVVEDTAVLTGAAMGYSGGNPITQTPAPPPAGTFQATVAFNTPYAAYQHEGQRQDGTRVVKNYKEPSAGPKFLEAPMMSNASKYAKIMTASLIEDLKNA